MAETQPCSWDDLLGLGARHPDLVVGLDFAFGFPTWWLDSRGLAGGSDVWTYTADHGPTILSEPHPPFFGWRGSQAPPADRRFRRTDLALQTLSFQPKSVFQLAGSGSVGVGSMRGMPWLYQLSRVYSIWPFEDPSGPVVVEIYPRTLTGHVNKTRFWSRHDYLHEQFDGQDEVLLERAAGSDDAFDAAVSALRMSEAAGALGRLGAVSDADVRREGWIWCPRLPP